MTAELVTGVSRPQIIATSWDEMRRRSHEEQLFQESLEPSDPRHREMFRFDLELGYLDVYWGGYEYSYELTRLNTPKKALAFLQHVCAKDWEHASVRRVSRLVRSLSAYFGWDLYSGDAQTAAIAPAVPVLAPRTTSNTQERAKLTPSLRYDVLVRDDFRCRACGYSVEQGAHLHIDHIIPISGGGLTEFRNLQALCSGCNLGKGARK